MILGKATKLESQFRLTYNMILNLLRVEDFKVEDMLKRSFAEFFSQHLQPEQQELLIKTEKQLSKLEKIECIMGEPDIENYHSIYSEISSINKQLMTMLLNSKNSSQILSSGRVLILKTQVFKKFLILFFFSKEFFIFHFYLEIWKYHWSAFKNCNNSFKKSSFFC